MYNHYEWCDIVKLMEESYYESVFFVFIEYISIKKLKIKLFINWIRIKRKNNLRLYQTGFG